MNPLQEIIPTTPQIVQRSVRTESLRGGTSSYAGKVVPITYIPVLREDSVRRCQMRIKIDMMETAELLKNGINVNLYAHFIPKLALDRFSGSMDVLNASSRGKSLVEGEDPVPYFDTIPFDNTAELNKVIGFHAAQGSDINSDFIESYNQLVNFRRKARSTKLPLRDLDATTLARCFWNHTGMKHIVPDYDLAKIEGEVPLNITDAMLPVKGIGGYAQAYQNSPLNVTEADGTQTIYNDRFTTNNLQVKGVLHEDLNNVWAPEVFAELQQNGITVSLSNIELAKKTVAMAEIRKKYKGIDEDYIIDLLMNGVRVPEEQMTQPILLSKKSTIMGYARRYATDAENLDQSVTNGETFVDMTIRTPAMNTGGMIIVTAEIVPEQLFERKKDYFLHATSVDNLPDTMKDFLDKDKVSVVDNCHVDVLHTAPEERFGYSSINHEWNRDIPRLGGKFYKPDTSSDFDEDRQHFWAVDTIDPTLTEDFYLCTDLHHNVFADTMAPPFEFSLNGRADIVGNTIMPPRIMEDTGDYDKMLEKADLSNAEEETSEE